LPVNFENRIFANLILEQQCQKPRRTPKLQHQKTILVRAEILCARTKKLIIYSRGHHCPYSYLSFIYLKLYLGPREVTGANQMHVAQDFWAKKDWDKAIKGDASYPGFEKIITDYSNTKAANLAYFYLGTAYLNKGEYRKAVDNLNQLPRRR
jgi:tetratricopeptide (TPR) repeat protein